MWYYVFMINNSKKEDRSLFTTVTAGVLSLAIAIITFLIFPITNFVDGVLVFIGVLLVVLSAITAISGKKGTIKEIIYMLSFWV